MRFRRFAASVAVVTTLVGCGGGPIEQDEEISETRQEVKPPTNAPCTILVKGVGLRNIEEDYLPHVITCENGGADLEALKAQAIAARSVAYYGIAKNGGICDSSGCQVYTCNAEPKDKAREAVEETAGMFLSYSDVLTYGFYLNGDKATSDPPSCQGDPDGYNEKYITYNWGLSGVEVEQTPLGSIQSPNEAVFGQNRGCMSQWGARCLEANKGFDAKQILQFYYGMDIEIRTASVSCEALADAGIEADADADAGSNTDADTDGVSDEAGDPDAKGDIEVEPADSTGGDGGCSLSPDSNRRADAWFLGLVALGAMAKRRSRARPVRPLSAT